jgi:alpha-glucosidase
VTHLLFEPHHDGSPTYVDNEAPALGSTTRVRVRTSTRKPVDAVWLRTVEDGEPYYYPCALVGGLDKLDHRERGDHRGRADHRGDDAVWWEGELPIHNPVQRYRFMVVTGDSYVWLNQAGIFSYDVPDAHDFVISSYAAAPDWGRDAVVYQVFPDRFARSAKAADRPTPAWAIPAGWSELPIPSGPGVSTQFYGGDLDGITEHLDHIAALGADTIYLTPVFPAESNHRYNASTFDVVDPLLGGDPAYKALIKAAHERGWRVLGDLTSNHTGDTHEWFVRASQDDQSVERGFYYFAADGTHEGWKGHETLPKLNHLDEELSDRFRAVVEKWLDFGIDGWRIDVANMTGRRMTVDIAHDVAREIREVATEAKPDALIVGEHGHDASGDLDGDGWHGTMNYYGFSFPVWTWLRKPEGHVPSFGLPVGVPLRTGQQSMTSMREFTARFGWRAVGASWNILGSHDSPRIRTTTGDPKRHHAAVALQFTLPGVPMVFAGDELGLEGVNGEDSRRTMPWDSEGSWDRSTIEVYRALADLRRAHPALTRGSLRWVHLGEDLVVYLREHPAGDLLVAVSRGGTPALELPITLGEVLYGEGEDGTTGIPAYDEPGATVWSVS